MQKRFVIYGSLSLFHSWLKDQNTRFNMQEKGVVDEVGQSWHTHLGSLTEVGTDTELHVDGYCWPRETYSDIRPVLIFSFTPIDHEKYELQVRCLEQTLDNLALKFLDAVEQQWPYKSKRGKRRGGPIPTPEEERVKIVKKWHQEQGTIPQWSFCQRTGISTSTLRRWEKELERQGKL